MQMIDTCRLQYPDIRVSGYPDHDPDTESKCLELNVVLQCISIVHLPVLFLKKKIVQSCTLKYSCRYYYSCSIIVIPVPAPNNFKVILYLRVPVSTLKYFKVRYLRFLKCFKVLCKKNFTKYPGTNFSTDTSTSFKIRHKVLTLVQIRASICRTGIPEATKFRVRGSTLIVVARSTEILYSSEYSYLDTVVTSFFFKKKNSPNKPAPFPPKKWCFESSTAVFENNYPVL